MKGLAGNDFYQKWKTDFEFRTIANSLLSSVITVLFALYNSVFGVRYGIIGNGCISILFFSNSTLTFLDVFDKIHNACTEGKSFVRNGWLDKATG